MPAKMLITIKKKNPVGDFHTYQNKGLLRTINNMGKCCLSFPHSTLPGSFNFSTATVLLFQSGAPPDQRYLTALHCELARPHMKQKDQYVTPSPFFIC